MHLLKYILCLSIFFSITPLSKATHIVGGELSKKHLSTNFNGELAELSLILYFDNINGNPLAEDQNVRVGIFSKTTNTLIDAFILPNIGSTPVVYTNPACAVPNLSTRKITYRAVVNLAASAYSEPGGYYMIWDRCCRNGNISNILNPGGSGQLFYMEFPRIRINNQAFINSSPSLFPPVSDYACINELFQFSIAGTDADGDSLVYSPVVPMIGNGGQLIPLPALQPAPYPTVFWNTSIGAGPSSMIPGNPSFAVSPTGLITFRPNFIGLNVFGVKCEEFRNGQKIGEVRRDFQIMVLSCPSNFAPSLSYIPTNNLPPQTVRLSDSACFRVWLKDVEPSSILNFSASILNGSSGYQVNSSATTVQTFANDSSSVDLCIVGCNPNTDTLDLEIIVKDSGCPFPLTDTLLLKVILDPISGDPPITIPSIPVGSVQVDVRGNIRIDFAISDASFDDVRLQIFSPDLPLNGLGMQLFPLESSTPFNAIFTWSPGCRFADMDSIRVWFVVNDIGCENNYDTLRYTFILTYENQAPTIQIVQPEAIPDSIFVLPIDDPFQLKVAVFDLDRDPFSLNLFLENSPKPEGMVWSITRTGDTAFIDLYWTPRCKETFLTPLTLRIPAKEQSCENLESERTVVLQVQDQSEDDIPPNVITPNGDGKNDFFSILYLPQQCLFKGVTIVNRWGRVIYTSTDDTFMWGGDGAPSGQYYYVAEYENKTIKGYITLLR